VYNTFGFRDFTPSQGFVPDLSRSVTHRHPLDIHSSLHVESNISIRICRALDILQNLNFSSGKAAFFDLPYIFAWLVVGRLARRLTRRSSRYKILGAGVRAVMEHRLTQKHTVHMTRNLRPSDLTQENWGPAQELGAWPGSRA